jgi:uncharacterized caspase-like protein
MRIAATLAAVLAFGAVAPLATLAQDNQGRQIQVTPARPAGAGEKIALVIGMDAYANVPKLQKGAKDAVAVGEALERIGFTVTTVLDAGRNDLVGKVTAFADAMEPDKVRVALVYFAGHGIELGGGNFVLPVDVPLPKSEADIRLSGIAATDIVARLVARSPDHVVLVFDACRDNPLGSTTRGLARVGGPVGSFVLFSSGQGRCPLEVLDPGKPDDGPSPFAAALARHIGDRSLDIRDLARAVQAEIVAKTAAAGNDQRPTFYDDLGGVGLKLAE